jgi:hypothetical protein
MSTGKYVPFQNAVLFSIQRRPPTEKVLYMFAFILWYKIRIPELQDEIVEAVDRYFSFPSDEKYARDIREFKEYLATQKLLTKEEEKKKKPTWYLHAKRRRDKGTSRHGTHFFVVSPGLRVSIRLSTSDKNYNTMKDAIEQSIIAGRIAASEFEVNRGIMDNNVSRRIEGRSVVLNPILP